MDKRGELFSFVILQLLEGKNMVHKHDKNYFQYVTANTIHPVEKNLAYGYLRATKQKDRTATMYQRSL